MIVKIIDDIVITMLAVALVRFITTAIGVKNTAAVKNTDDAELGINKALHDWSR